MKPLYPTKVIRQVDRFAINNVKVPSIVLMENAAIEIFNHAVNKFSLSPKISKIGFVCGKGNNAGDGFALARHFINNKYKVVIIYVFGESEMSPDCRTNFLVLKKMLLGLKSFHLQKYKGIHSISKLKGCGLIVDALLGSGIQGTLKEPYYSIVKQINKLKSLKLSIDIPTGLDADNGYTELAVKSELTVTLGELKPGLFFGDGYSTCGEVRKGNIGISSDFYPPKKCETFLIEANDAKICLAPKDKSIHKYSAGKVLTIAGSGQYSGAAVFTAKSALRVGAGSSILCFPKSIKAFIHKTLGEVVLKEYKDNGKEYLSYDNIEEITPTIKWADVVAIGPGLGRTADTQIAIIKLLKQRKYKNIVIDADALYALRNKLYRTVNLRNAVLTPHHGEFCGLLGIQLSELKKDILKFGKKFVKETCANLVLKGAPTILFTSDGKILINSVGNPGMAKFGTGDVLTGVLAGLIAQGKDLENALIAGIYIHSLAADLLLPKYTEYGFTAVDIINNLPKAIKYLWEMIV